MGNSREWCVIEFDRVGKDVDYLDAVLFFIDREPVWIPRSCLRDGEYEMDEEGGTGRFEIPEEFAIKKGLV